MLNKHKESVSCEKQLFLNQICNKNHTCIIATLLLLMHNFLIFSYEYPRPVDGYYSQKGQDKYLNEKLFKGKKNGFFVDIGAHDGISFSNTYFFEKNLDWEGVCVDPNPNVFIKLKENRRCICEQLCISDSNEKRPFLLCSGYILEMYSGLLDNYDPRHLDRIDQEINLFGGDKTVIFVDCSTLQNLLDKHHISYIDFLSMDIEGGEEDAIKSIDFERVIIDVIVIENNFNELRIKEYLQDNGYELVTHIGKDDIYVLKEQNV